jgi:uncharacterized surface protein with fasciclin (FAS1) repeats
MKLKLLFLIAFFSIRLHSQTITDIVVNSPVHNTLEAAVIAAGLAPALSAPGALTVFAPTDQAFAALPAGTLTALFANPQGALTKILTYHVVSGIHYYTQWQNSKSKRKQWHSIHQQCKSYCKKYKSYKWYCACYRCSIVATTNCDGRY